MEICFGKTKSSESSETDGKNYDVNGIARVIGNWLSLQKSQQF